MSTPTIATRDEWLAARDALLVSEKEHTRRGRRSRPAAPRAPVAARGQELHPADGGRPEDAGGAVRRPLPAGDLSLHVRPRLRAWLPRVLVDRRQLQRRAGAPQGPRRDDDVRLAGAGGEAAGREGAAGLEASTGPPATRATSTPTTSIRSTRERASEWVPDAPPIVAQNAADCGTDPAGYMMQRPGLSVFALHDGEVYLTYASTNRGLEVVMTYYGILDRTPRGRDEGEPASATWMRRHDEFATASR